MIIVIKLIKLLKICLNSNNWKKSPKIWYIYKILELQNNLHFKFLALEKLLTIESKRLSNF